MFEIGLSVSEPRPGAIWQGGRPKRYRMSCIGLADNAARGNLGAASRNDDLKRALRACSESRLCGSLIERRLPEHAVGLCQIFGANESRMGRSGRASGLDCRVPGRSGGATGVRPQDFLLTDAAGSQGWQIGRRHTAATGRCRATAPEWSTKKPLPAGQPSVGQLSVGKNWGDREGSRCLRSIGGLLQENSARSVRICPADLIVGG